MQELEAEARQIQAKNKVHIFNSVSNLPWNSLLRYMMYSLSAEVPKSWLSIFL